MYKIPSPTVGPKDWANPAVLFEPDYMPLPNGMVWDMDKRKIWYNDTAGETLDVFKWDSLCGQSQYG